MKNMTNKKAIMSLRLGFQFYHHFPYTTVTSEVHDRVKIKTILIMIVQNQIYDNILSVINHEK